MPSIKRYFNINQSSNNKFGLKEAGSYSCRKNPSHIFQIRSAPTNRCRGRQAGRQAGRQDKMR
ncbi:MAG: hypothetical protein ACI9A1_001143, partial [Lentimonas sp.]